VQRTGAHLRVAVDVARLARGRGPVASPLITSEVAPPAPISDVAELLHIDMHRVPGVRVLVAAHRFPGGPVDVGEPADPGGGQDAVHRGGREGEHRRELHWSEAFLPPDVHDLADHRCRRPARAVMGPRGAVDHPGLALVAVAPGPAVRGRPGDWEPTPPQEVLTYQDQSGRVVTRPQPTSPISTPSAAFVARQSSACSRPRRTLTDRSPAIERSSPDLRTFTEGGLRHSVMNGVA